jgi:hypothetical protein
MNIRKVIQERIRRSAGGVEVDSDVHAVVAANVGEQGAVTHVSSTQRSASSKHSGTERSGAKRDDD